MATWGEIFLLDSGSPVMEQLNFFHDHSLMILLLITVFVSYVMISMLFNQFADRHLLDGDSVESIWTIIPAIILIFIGLPSLRLLYLLDELSSPSMTIKTIGHQWYWSYEYSDFKEIEFDSYMIPSAELQSNGFRLLDVDHRIVLPTYTQIRMIVSAADVLHSWTIPTLGVKVDATPGRLNQTNLYMVRSGLFFGQCSEICGVNHSFMPIVIEAIPIKPFIKTIQTFYNNSLDGWM
uniref:Cytochrome c oxidase subunit 2 n=2 Tax=Culicoides humeralis TaxID=573117 RepID=B5U9E9_9DIPT|nr:cytochrome c oxidase subunit II [Culicoides humeralis]